MSDCVLQSAAVGGWRVHFETERSSLFAPAAVVGVCLLVGLVAGGWILGSEIKDIRLAGRYVTVKGLVERTVKSDMATWPVSFKEAGNDLPQVFAKSEADKTAVLKFFAGQGIVPGEITVGQIKGTDKLANEYGGENTGAPNNGGEKGAGQA